MPPPRLPPPYNLVVVSPEGPLPEGALAGTPAMVRNGLARLGLPARIAFNEYLRDATNILFAVQNLDPSLIEVLPRDTIVYNTEMVAPGSPFLASILPFVRAFETWDYSPTNVRRWGELGLGARVRLVQPAYLPENTFADLDAPRDVDVLFYGHSSPRRAATIAAIAATGLRVEALEGVYAAELQPWIERSRIVLNVHHRDDAVFEFARLSVSLSNRRCFVTEAGGEDDVDPALRPGYVSARLDELPTACRALVDDADRREAIARRGYELYRATDFARNLARALDIGPTG